MFLILKPLSLSGINVALNSKWDVRRSRRNVDAIPLNYADITWILGMCSRLPINMFSVYVFKVPDSAFRNAYNIVVSIIMASASFKKALYSSANESSWLRNFHNLTLDNEFVQGFTEDLKYISLPCVASFNNCKIVLYSHFISVVDNICIINCVISDMF